MIFEMSVNIAKTIRSATTIVEPTGVLATTEARIPTKEQNTAIIVAHMVTLLKFLQTLMAESAGNTIRAEMRSEPTRFIARTMTTAIIVARRRLYIPLSLWHV